VSALNTPELAQFPLDDFFDHYEKGLRKVTVSLFVCVCVCVCVHMFIVLFLFK